MEPLEFVLGVIIVGAVALAGRGGHKGTAAELRAIQDRARTLEAQLVTARLQNEQLHKQLDWHARLLEAQDRLAKQLADSPARPPAGGPGAPQYR
jgi:hypothetical protein